MAEGTDPEELERRIERTREELARTIDEIVDWVSPRRVARRSVAKARANAERIIGSVGDYLGTVVAPPAAGEAEGEAEPYPAPRVAPVLIGVGAVIVIGAAIGLGEALTVSGAAGAIASSWIAAFGDNPWLALLGIYLLTNLFTEVLTNNAAAVLIFPIAAATAESLDVSFRPLVFAIMMAASAGFATPIGYQTNLMVYGPGGYRFADYVRFGVPLNVLIGAVTVVLAPTIWPF